MRKRYGGRFHEGLNVIEQWNGANDFVFFARRGELVSNRTEDHELSRSVRIKSRRDDVPLHRGRSCNQERALKRNAPLYSQVRQVARFPTPRR